MTRYRHERLLTEAQGQARELLGALNHCDLQRAEEHALRLHELGVQGLARMTPRGTLGVAAGNRLNAPDVIDSLVSRLREIRSFPKPLLGACLDALGVWAGGEALPIVIAVLRDQVDTKKWSDTRREVFHKGLYALHLIGGPEAAQELRDLSYAPPPVPRELRDRAGWYLNELGTRAVDHQVGSDEGAEPSSPQEVAVQDDLWDPYQWQEARASLEELLLETAREYWKRGEAVLKKALSTEVRDALEPALRGDLPQGPEWIDSLEKTVLSFLIPLSETRLLTLGAVRAFFREEDVEKQLACQALPGWQYLRLRQGSESAAYLDALDLFQAPYAAADLHGRDEEGLTHDLQVVLRSWVDHPLSLVRLYGKRRQAFLVLAVAALHYRTHEDMNWPQGMEFPEFVQTLFFSYAAQPLISPR